MNLARCRSCGAPIFWCVTVNGKRIPIDRVPAPDGNVTLSRTKTGDLLAVVHAASFPPPGAKRWQSHFRSCRNAKEHRRKSA